MSDSRHVNNWSQTPSVLTAYTFDNFATVMVTGRANPRSLVDIFFDTQISVTRQSPVLADASGVFTFTGALPGSSVQVFAASTLADPTYPGRVDSSSQLSAFAQVFAAQPTSPVLTVFGSVSDISGPIGGPAQPGDVVRFNVTLSNAGAAAVTGIHGEVLPLPPGLAARPGSGSMHGAGGGFTATDAGFSGGILAAGQTATYSLDADVTAAAPVGMAIFNAQVAADGIASTVASGSLPIAARTRLWLPLLSR